MSGSDLADRIDTLTSKPMFIQYLSAYSQQNWPHVHLLRNTLKHDGYTDGEINRARVRVAMSVTRKKGNGNQRRQN
jgi:hypothetical protein